MSSRRVLKVAESIREVVAMAILTELKDPRISDVTVTFVEVSADLRHAKVHVTVMGDETKQNLSLRGLQSAAGFLQTKVAKRIDTRYTPHLLFVLDRGVMNSAAVSRILDELFPKSAETNELADNHDAAEVSEFAAVTEDDRATANIEGGDGHGGDAASHI